MAERWIILGVLFLARTSMAFQFQAIAALSPQLMASRALTLADIGILIGLYLAPGVAVALPGGAVAARFGEKRVVGLSMIAMLAGGLLASLGEGYGAAMAGRLVAGAGGVVLNVVMTKMLVDWFAGREVSTAMAIYINSWPVGIALALVILPAAATVGGLEAAETAVLGFVALGLALFCTVYRAAPGASAGPALSLGRIPFWPVFLAGLIWALYNSALAMVFSFAPALLTERGLDALEAGSMTSLFMIVFSLAVPFGGVLADRTRRRDMVIAASFLGFATVLPFALAVPPAGVIGVFVVAGILFAFAAGPIMSLPASVLPPESRGFGMGVFFTIYYAVMMAAPALAGRLAEAAGGVSVTLWTGVGMCLASLAALVAFRRGATARAIAGAGEA